MKQTIKINENQLKQIVNESVKQVLKESNVSVYNELVEIAEHIGMIKESGLIAFTSPAPSSTETELKSCIENAEHSIYKAMRLYQSLYK